MKTLHFFYKKQQTTHTRTQTSEIYKIGKNKVNNFHPNLTVNNDNNILLLL